MPQLESWEGNRSWVSIGPCKRVSPLGSRLRSEKELDVAARELPDDGASQCSAVLIHRQISSICQFIAEGNIDRRTNLPLGAQTEPELLSDGE